MSWEMVMARAASLSDQELGLRYKWERTVFVTNLAYECKWPMLKDFMKENVGEVMFCDVFEENGRSSGTAAVEFKNLEDARNACRLNLKLLGRRLSIFMDEGGRRTRRAAQQSVVARVMAGKGEGGFKPPMREREEAPHNLAESIASAVGHPYGPGNHNPHRSPPLPERARSSTRPDEPPVDRHQGRLYTLLRRLGVENERLSDRIVVSNLDSRVTRQKLFDVFSLAGNVIDVAFLSTPPGVCPSAAIQFDRVVDALQAIAMLDGQYLFERRMLVRLSGSSLRPPSPMKLPAGLGGIGDRLDIEDLLVCQNAIAEGDRMAADMSARRKRAVDEGGARMLSPVMGAHEHHRQVSGNHESSTQATFNSYSRHAEESARRDMYDDLRRRLKQPKLEGDMQGVGGAREMPPMCGDPMMTPNRMSMPRGGDHGYRDEPLNSSQHYSERLRNALYPVDRSGAGGGGGGGGSHFYR